MIVGGTGKGTGDGDGGRCSDPDPMKRNIWAWVPAKQSKHGKVGRGKGEKVGKARSLSRSSYALTLFLLLPGMSTHAAVMAVVSHNDGLGIERWL